MNLPDIRGYIDQNLPKINYEILNSDVNKAIKSDKKRYADAITGAKEIAQEELTKVNSILKVSKSAYPKGFAPSSRRNNPATLGSL